MTPAALAGEYLYDLWNDADHAAKLADMARRAFGAGNYAEAVALIEQAKDPAGRLDMRLRDCERVVAGLVTGPAFANCLLHTDCGGAEASYEDRHRADAPAHFHCRDLHCERH